LNTLDKNLFKKIIFPSITYGLAWKLSLSYPIGGFIFFIVVGFIYGLTLLLTDYLKETLIAILVSLSLGFISSIPIIGPFIAAAIIIYFSFKQLKEILDNFLLIIAGFLIYILLMYTPQYFHSLYIEKLQFESNGLIDILIGSFFFGGIALLLNSMGYEIKKIFIFTIGLPAFIFLFNLARKNSPFN
jgi:hypothetical protein